MLKPHEIYTLFLTSTSHRESLLQSKITVALNSRDLLWVLVKHKEKIERWSGIHTYNRKIFDTRKNFRFKS